MTVTNRLNRATMDGNGVSTTLALDFPFHSVEDLVVIETILATGAETTKVLNTDYTIVGAQDDAGHYPDGGDIVFTVAPASTVRMTAYRDPPMLQGVVLQETGKIPVKAAIESPLDKLTMIDQRLSERIDRALRLSDGDSLEMGRLPVKSVRASRYLGFDGDGNPTMMTTPQGVLTPISQLTESLISALPAAGSAGSLRKVTDDARGVWMDTGAAWVPLNKGEINALDFLKGDGTDETTAFQAMLDTGKNIYFPRPSVAYAATELTLSTSHQRLTGAGSGAIIKALDNTKNLFTPSTNLTGVVIENLALYGAATTDATNHYAIFTSTTKRLTRCTIRRVLISGPNSSTGFNNLILLDVGSDDSTVEHCYVERLIGDISGRGYGVQLGNCDRVKVLYNTFIGATGQGRHGVYVGSGSSFATVIGNIIVDFNQAPITVYTLSSQTVSELNYIADNIIIGGVAPAAENGGIELHGYIQRNHVFGNTIDGYGRYGIVVSDSGQGGLNQDNVVQGNVVRDCEGFGIVVIGAKRAVILGNEVYQNSQESSGTYDAINIRSAGTFGTEEAVGTIVMGNRVAGSDHRSGVGIDSSAPVPSGTVLRGNILLDGQLGAVSYAGVIVSGDDMARYGATYSASITPVAYGYLRTQATVSASNNSNFTINAPTDPREGKELVVTIRNTSGGALGTLSFNAVFKVGASWTQPATGTSRSIQFLYDGTNWIETGRTAADVAT